MKVKGIRLKKETLENFLKAVDQVAPWFPVSGHLTGPSWEKLGKDLKFAEEQGVLVKGMQLVESVFKGPLPPNTVGLLLGRSSVTLQGLVVHPGVIDSDYTGQVKIMVSSPWGIVAISPGDCMHGSSYCQVVIPSFQLMIKKEGIEDLVLREPLQFTTPWTLMRDLYLYCR